MTTEETREVPNVEIEFTTLLKKFKIGGKGGIAPETIAENISRTGGEMVYEDPQKLAERLATWHESISPVNRKQIMEQWFAGKGVEIPEDAIKLAGIKSSDMAKREEEEKRRKEDEEKRKSKFFYDDKTGVIRGAKDGELGMTWDEAEKVADRAKAESEAKADKGRRGVFILDKDGNLQVAEGATLTAEDVAVMNAVGKAQATGDTRSAMEILKDKVEEYHTMQELTGGGKKTGTLEDEVQRWEAMKKVFGGDEETKTLLSGIYSLLKEGAKGTGESQEAKDLKERFDKLLSQMEKDKEERQKEREAAFLARFDSMETRFTKELADAKAKDEYGIMSQGMTTVASELKGVRGDFASIFGKRPAPFTEAERKQLTEGISEEAKGEDKLRKLEEKVFFGGGQKEG